MIMAVINNIMPAYIFLSLTALIITIDLSEFAKLWKLFALFFAMLISYYLILFFKILMATRKTDITVKSAIKAILSPYFAALMTASSLAAFNKSLSCSTNDFGIPVKDALFYMSTGRTVYKPASTGNYIVIACFFAAMSGSVNMTMTWYITAFITCLILGIATPPITGGAKTCYTILFLQLGIPIEWLALVIAVDTLFDFFRTASNVGGLQVELLSIHEKEKRRTINSQIIPLKKWIFQDKPPILR